MKKVKNLCDNKNHIPQLLTSAFIAIFLSFYILYVGSGNYQSITEAKFSAFRWIAGGYIMVMILLKIEMLIIGQEKLISPKALLEKSSWTQRFVVLFLIFTSLSALLSKYGQNTIIGLSSYEGLFSISIYVLCFLFISLYGIPAKWQIYLLGLTMSLFCLLSILQLMGYNPLLLYPKGYNYYDANIAYSGAYLGTIGNIDLVAALLCIAIPVLGVSIVRIHGKLKYLLVIPTALCLAVLLISNVQAGIVGIVCGLFTISPLILPIKIRTKKILWIFILIIVMLGALYIWFYNSRENGTIYEAHELLHGRWNDDFGSGRLYIWRNVVELIPQHPLFGGGPDTLYARINGYFERYDTNLGLTIHGSIGTAHNDYLNIIVNQGILAFLCYICALINTVVRAIKNSDKDIVVICGSAVLCYSIQAFFGISMFIIAPFFWMTWAMLEHSINNERKF